jgi:anti-sigma B factor antagonist
MQGSTVVEIYGEIDLTTAAAVQAPLDAATALPGARLIVDLRAVVFFDCAVLTLLHRARRRVSESGGALGLVCVRPWHRKVLAAGGVTPLVPMFATVQEALVVARPD